VVLAGHAKTAHPWSMPLALRRPCRLLRDRCPLPMEPIRGLLVSGVLVPSNWFGKKASKERGAMMKPRYFRMLLAVAGMAVGAFAQAHPDLSGVWSFTIDLSHQTESGERRQGRLQGHRPRPGRAMPSSRVRFRLQRSPPTSRSSRLRSSTCSITKARKTRCSIAANPVCRVSARRAK
jgi:hypothetical protein